MKPKLAATWREHGDTSIEKHEAIIQRIALERDTHSEIGGRGSSRNAAQYVVHMQMVSETLRLTRARQRVKNFEFLLTYGFIKGGGGH